MNYATILLHHRQGTMTKSQCNHGDIKHNNVVMHKYVKSTDCIEDIPMQYLVVFFILYV